MPPSRTIAGLMGPLMAAIGLSLLLRPQEFAAVTASLSEILGAVYLTGCLLLVASCAIVRTHNVWAVKWPVAITIFGWLTILGGLARIFFPQAMAARTVGFADSPMALAVGGTATLTFGVFLTVMSLRKAAASSSQ